MILGVKIIRSLVLGVKEAEISSMYARNDSKIIWRYNLIVFFFLGPEKRSQKCPREHQRMSGGKASGKKAAQYTGKKSGEGSVATSRDTAAAEVEVHAPGHTHRQSMRLKEMLAAKQAGGQVQTEKGIQLAAQKKRTRTTRQAPTMQPPAQPALLAADDVNAFVAALEAIPADDWCRTWAAGRTFMVRRTSKVVKEVVDKMRLPAVVRLSRSFWGEAKVVQESFVSQTLMVSQALMVWQTLFNKYQGAGGEVDEAGVLQLVVDVSVSLGLSVNRRIAEQRAAELLQAADTNGTGTVGFVEFVVFAKKRLDLFRLLEFHNDTAEKLQFVLRQLSALTAQCRISTLELPRCEMKGQDAERFAGVLAQCPALAHLDLRGNFHCGAGGAERLGGVLGQSRELVHLNLSGNQIGDAGAKSLAGQMSQCSTLVHLNLSWNRISDAGAESVAGVLAQCRALVHLDLSDNSIGADGTGRLARVLEQCRALAHLNLCGNQMGTQGAGVLAGVLPQCRALAHLNLSNNGIEAGAAERLRASWHGEVSDLLL